MEEEKRGWVMEESEERPVNGAVRGRMGNGRVRREAGGG